MNNIVNVQNLMKEKQIRNTKKTTMFYGQKTNRMVRLLLFIINSAFNYTRIKQISH